MEIKKWLYLLLFVVWLAVTIYCLICYILIEKNEKEAREELKKAIFDSLEQYEQKIFEKEEEE